MKLFQQLLVAGAALGMVAPMAAQAADINLEDMKSYSSGSLSDGFNLLSNKSLEIVVLFSACLTELFC